MGNDFFLDTVSNTETKTYKYYSGVEWKESVSGKTVPIISPIDTTPLGYVQAVQKDEIDDVINYAKDAQKEWEAVPLHKRITMVHLAADWIRHYQDAFIEVLVSEIGKSKEESKSEVLRTADLIDYFAREVQSITGDHIDSGSFPGFENGKYALVERVALGVVLAIGPFNYPVNLVASKIAPALLMGNAVVVKPPTQGSISGLLLTQAFVKAGIPKGIISCVTGQGRDIGDYLVSHPGISMIAFTGSSGIGQAIAHKAGMKPLLFECGGNNPALVFHNADLSLTAKEIVKGGFSFAGQRCTAIKYVLAQKETLDELIPLVQEQMKMLIHMGDPREETTKLVGPVISVAAAEQIEKVVQEAVANGGKIICGGKRTDAYIEPTLLTNISSSMRVVTEETFGPVLSFISVTTMNEAVAIVNDSTYGLQTSIFTGDEGTGINVAKHINVGTVQINGSPQRGPDHFPFMGIKGSGLGVQGVRYSLEAMSRLKSIVINNPQ